MWDGRERGEVSGGVRKGVGDGYTGEEGSRGD